MQPGEIRIGDRYIKYYSSDTNTTSSNERKIEIPLGLDFLSRFPNSSIIEVGAVMPYYMTAGHRVIDLFDTYPRAEHVDAATLKYNGANVLSISTIEHMGTDNSWYGKLYKATNYSAGPEFLAKIVAESKNYLITFPIGWDRKLDEYVRTSGLRHVVFKRDANNIWALCHEKNWGGMLYNHPYHAGNYLCIVTNIEGYYEA